MKNFFNYRYFNFANIKNVLKNYSFLTGIIMLNSVFYIVYEDGIFECLVAFFSCFFTLHILFNLRFALKVLNEFSQTEEEKLDKECKRNLIRIEYTKVWL
jgi:hypothetical protein